MQYELSALMLATAKGHLDIVKLLLDAKAPVDYRDKVILLLPWMHSLIQLIMYDYSQDGLLCFLLLRRAT